MRQQHWILERKTLQTSGESESETRGVRIKTTILNQTHQKSRRNGRPNEEVADPARRTPLKLRGHWSHFGRETGTEQATWHPQYCTLARGHGLTPRRGREVVGSLTPSGWFWFHFFIKVTAGTGGDPLSCLWNRQCRAQLACTMQGLV